MQRERGALLDLSRWHPASSLPANNWQMVGNRGIWDDGEERRYPNTLLTGRKSRTRILFSQQIKGI